MSRPYLTLQHALLPSFDAQQDAFLVFNLRLLHGHDLLHRQQVLLWTEMMANKSKQTTPAEWCIKVGLGITADYVPDETNTSKGP